MPPGCPPSQGVNIKGNRKAKLNTNKLYSFFHLAILLTNLFLFDGTLIFKIKHKLIKPFVILVSLA